MAYQLTQCRLHLQGYRCDMLIHSRQSLKPWRLEPSCNNYSRKSSPRLPSYLKIVDVLLRSSIVEYQQLAVAAAAVIMAHRLKMRASQQPSAHSMPLYIMYSPGHDREISYDISSLCLAILKPCRLKGRTIKKVIVMRRSTSEKRGHQEKYCINDLIIISWRMLPYDKSS